MNRKDGLRIGIILSVALFVMMGCQSTPPQQEQPAQEKAQAQEESAQPEQPQAGDDQKQESAAGEEAPESKQQLATMYPVGMEPEEAEAPEAPEDGLQAAGIEPEAEMQAAGAGLEPEAAPAGKRDLEALALERLQKKADQSALQQQQEKAFVAHLVRTARAKLSNYEYQAAKSFLDRALDIDPTHEEALEMRGLVGNMLGERKAQGENLQKLYEQEIQVRIEQAKIEAQNHYRKGLKDVEAHNYDEAIRSFEKTLEIIRWAPYELGLGSLEKQTQAQVNRVQELRGQWVAEQKKKRMDESRQMAEKLEAEEQARRAGQIRILLSQATDYFARKQYENAEQVIGEVLSLDPSNRVAMRLRDDIRDARHDYISQATLAKKIEGWKLFVEDMNQVAIPHSDLLLYPDRDYWENVILKREDKGALGQLGETKVEQEGETVKRIQRQLDSNQVRWDFSETPFQEVITVIRYEDNINIVVDPRVIQNFELEGVKVTLQLDNLTLRDALNILLDLYNLTYVFRNDVLFITTRDSELAQRKVFPVLHDIRDLTGQLKDFPGPRIQLMDTQGEEVGAGAMFSEEEGEAAPVLTGERLMDLIKASIAPETWASETGLYSVDETSGQLLVVHEEAVQREIRQFLNELRSFSGTMVSIESRFLEVTDDFLEQVGVDWKGIGESNLTSTGNRIAMPGVTAGREDEAAGAAGNLPYDNNAATPFSASPSAGLFFGRGNLSGGNNRDAMRRTDVRVRSENIDDQALGDRLKATGGLALQIATLDDLQLNAVLWMVRKTARGELLMAPRLTAFNTQRSSLTVVQQRAYVRDFDVEVAQSAYIADPVIGTIQTGVVLDVRPIISSDRKYITLELRPTIASLSSLTPFTTELGGRGRTVTFEVPEIRLQSVETTVRIPDQGTLLLGGLKSFREIDRKLDIPILGNIPIISFFFSQRSRVEEKQNLLIMVTGKIIDLEEEERQTFGSK